jgi:type I restriction enzyme, S subunit
MSGIACWVTAKDLRHRLDADFYRPEYLEFDHRAEARGLKMRQVVEISLLVTDGTHKTPSYVDSGVPFLSAKNIRNGFVDAGSGHKYVSAAEFDQLERWNCAPRPDDVLVAKSGSIGSAGLASGAYDRFAVFESVAIIRPSGVSPAYLSAYLNSRLGQLQIRRNSKGAVIRHLHLEDLREVEVPLPDRRIQDYIGAKVELAERCRSHSVKLRRQALEFLAQSWAWGNRGPAELQDEAASQIAYTVEPRIFEDRLDPEFYRPSFLAVDRWLDGQPCWRLSELVEAPVKGVQPSYDPKGTVPALTVTHVDPFVLDRNGASGLVTDAWLSRNARARIEAGELLYTVTGPPLGETVVVEEFHLPAAVNSHVARVALRPHFKFPHLVAGMLNSPLGQLQTTRYSKGIRQKELYPVDFVRFRFPKLSSQTCTRLERDLAASCRLVEEARVLVEQAKADVEALIEDTLDVQAILAGTVKAPTADDIPELAEDGT